MKIKELFKEMEKANQFAKMVNDDEEWELEVAICQSKYFDWYFGKSFKTQKDFQKYLKEEYTDNLVDAIKDVEIKMGEEGNGEGNFSLDLWWRDGKDDYTIKVHFWKHK